MEKKPAPVTENH